MKLDSSTGSVLFGGIDTKKFQGDLVSIDVEPASKNANITSFTVAFTSLSATSSSGSDTLTPANYATAAVLDSGTTITLLPDDLASLVFKEVGAQLDDQLGAVIVPCSLAGNSGTINYGFGGSDGPIIKVQMSELVLPLETPDGQSFKYNNGETACQFGIQPAGSLPVLFGDTFLRSAYAVYDLVNNKIALANTDFNATESNVVAFPSQGAAIPSATAVANQASISGTAATGLPRVDPTGTVGGSTPTVSSGSSGSTTTLSASAGFTGDNKTGAASITPAFQWSMLAIMGGAILSTVL